MPRIAAVLLLIACGLAITPMAQAGEEFTERVFPLPGQGAFSLWVPESWWDETTRPEGELPPTIMFLPAHGQGFQILITPIWPADDTPAGHNSARTIRTLVEESAGFMQKGAVENPIEVRPIDDVTGYYFSATDASLVGKTPPPGEYRHLTQGILAVGDLLCTFTVLSDYPDDPAALILAALGTAAHRNGN